MKKIILLFLGRVYWLYLATNFTIGFLVVFPFLMLSHYAKLPLLNTWVCKIWHICFYTSLGIWVKNKYKAHFSANKTYIFCANHTSFLDIATMAGLMKGNYAFVGKSDIIHVPLFGWMFRKMHIPVDRESKVASARAFLQMKKALQSGKSLIIFPEGGIFTQNPPEMVEFKDGAFRLAIETQTPIVPITLKWAWKVLPDDNSRRAYPHYLENIIHPALNTQHLTLKDLPKLKKQVFEIIQSAL
ncbi:MAG: lysophospholipid acyltransferase family protein [Raineya sp.]|nr:1-acyl-sn-glycerol-3-phosphate acyltransferase [Raineya sp.]MDW8297254.1 lysophospholipid acyltransferase family protein [Raineya sp.]